MALMDVFSKEDSVQITVSQLCDIIYAQAEDEIEYNLLTSMIRNGVSREKINNTFSEYHKVKAKVKGGVNIYE